MDVIKRRARPLTWAAGTVWLLSLAVAQLAAAQAPDLIGEVRLFGEEEFTVRAATKTELPLSKVPGSVTVISAQQIKESGARTIPELLRLVAGVNVRWNPMVQTLDMRSFGQNPFTSRVLLLIDGVPYNSWNKGGFPQHPGFDFFILQNIKSLEIVRGPGSSLYGENAFWGVINIVTLSGEDLEGGKVEAGYGDLSYESLGTVYGKSGKQGSILVSGRVQRGQLPVEFWSESEVKGSDIFVKGKLHDFELSYYRHDDDLDGFSQPGFQPGTTFHSAATIEQTVDILALKYNHTSDRGYSFSSDVSLAERNGSRCAACHAAPQNPAFTKPVDHGSQLIGDFRFGVQKFRHHDLLFGVEARHLDTGGHKDELLSPADATEPLVFDYSKLAAYFQDQISLAQDRFRLTLGARYDDSNDLFDSETSPRIAFVYNPSQRWVVRGGWSQAFRFPNFSELYQASYFLSLDGGTFVRPITVFQPNPGLQPEQIQTLELGTEVRVNPALSAKLDLFRSEIDDFIVLAFIGTGPTRLRFENHPDSATVTGAELELRWRPSARFTGFFNYTWQNDESDGRGLASDGRPIEFVYSPENKANLGLYLGPFAGFRVALESQWRAERLGPSAWNIADRTQTGVLDAYLNVNLRLSWDAPVHIGNRSDALRFSVYGKNLLDEDIVETFLPVDMHLPGTTYYGTVELRF